MTGEGREPKGRFAICVGTGEYAGDLEIRKVYEVLPDPDAERHGQMRVIDESGEDYLYPKRYFHEVERPQAVTAPGKTATRFGICVRNDEYPASLETRKIYEVLPDPEGERLGFIRVIDESGEDYFFPKSYFMELDLPASVEKALRRAS